MSISEILKLEIEELQKQEKALVEFDLNIKEGRKFLVKWVETFEERHGGSNVNVLTIPPANVRK